MAAEDGKRSRARSPRAPRPAGACCLRRPLGVLGLITPWNWPYTMPAEVLAPALACGNCVVWTRPPPPSARGCSRSAWPRPTCRRASSTSCSARGRRWATSWRSASARGGVHGLDRDRPDRGAPGRGQGAAARDGRQRAVRRDGRRRPPGAAEAARVGCFLGAGQSCSAAERLLVHEAVREEFVALLAARSSARCGSATRSTTDHDGAGQRARRREDGRARGRRRRARRRGRHRRQPGRRVPTASLGADGARRVPADSIAVTQETFGPIAPIVASARSRTRSSRRTRRPSG